jgi:universal stress protein A
MKAKKPTARPAPAKGVGILPFKTILASTDFSDASLEGVRHAAGLAQRFGARLILLHALEPPLQPAELGYTPIEFPNLEETLTREAKERLIELKGKLGFENAETIVHIGPAFQVIVSTAEQTGADLIVISTHGYTGLKHVLIGSTAERVVRHATCPVLALRAGQIK